jgi:hypothetical protein
MNSMTPEVYPSSEARKLKDKRGFSISHVDVDKDWNQYNFQVKKNSVEPFNERELEN